jgi:acyl carrier protein
MTKTEIEQILAREIGITLGGIQVGEDVPLHELGLDSMGFVGLLVFIEKKFDLKLVDSGLSRDNFRTVRVLANNIYEKLKLR